ncbi:MAG: putative DNA binding domain-containing protein, partial [Pontiellaceae bacterium]|nr:putative DNA binding domain-containing protein [Pontiellaceae bacterium]
KLYHYCVAIANEGGGQLILGVADKPPRPVVGTAAFNDPIEMASKLFAAVGFRVDIEEVAHPDGRVLVFHVPPRPRGTAYHYEGTYLMRSGQELVPMSEDQLRRIFAEGQPGWLEDIAVSQCSAQDVIQLLDTQSYFDLIKRPYPTTQPAVLERLTEEGFIVGRKDGYAINNLGAILLAKKLELFPAVKRKAPRVVVYTGESKLETKSDQPGEKGYAAGFEELVKYVMSQLPQNEIIRNAVRKEIKLVPEVVIRELTANALIHQDFTISGSGPMIEVYANRVEISNPGLPIVPVERFIDGYQSRNEKLADLMRRFGICEEKSSGIDRVVQTAELYQLPAPDFQSGYNRTVVIMYGPREFRKMDRADRIRACYQHCVLQWVLRRQMTNQSLRERFKLTERNSGDVSKIITATADAGLIKPDPSGTESRKYAKYIPEWA